VLRVVYACMQLIAGKCGEDAQPVPGACAIWFGLIIPVVIFLPIALDGEC